MTELRYALKCVPNMFAQWMVFYICMEHVSDWHSSVRHKHFNGLFKNWIFTQFSLKELKRFKVRKEDNTSVDTKDIPLRPRIFYVVVDCFDLPNFEWLSTQWLNVMRYLKQKLMMMNCVSKLPENSKNYLENVYISLSRKQT